jgi:hypothetical protein
VNASPVAAFLAGAPIPPQTLSPEGDLRLLQRLPSIFPFRAAG